MRKRSFLVAACATLCALALTALTLTAPTAGRSTGAVARGPIVGAPDPDAFAIDGSRAVEDEGGMLPDDAYFLAQRTATGVTPTAAQLARAGRQAETLRARSRAASTPFSSTRWKPLGPANIGARVTDLAADVAREDTVYAASASGGVWKSTDAGRTFRSIWPITLPQAIGALVMGPDGTLWAGTGESNPGGGSVTYFGDGVYRSTDRGRTWRHVGLDGTHAIGRIAVDPKNPRHVLVAASGDLFNPGGKRGLYETRDFGATWHRLFAPPNGTTGAVDVAIDPKNPKHVLVGMWDHIRYPDRRIYTGEGSGIWMSTDGTTYTRLGPESGLPPASSEVGRIGVAFDPSDPSKAYSIYANNREGSFQAFYASTDGGAHWILPPGNATLGASQSVYGWWFGKLWVDPHDSNHIFLTGLTLGESLDGGVSFIPQEQQHVDHHAIAFDPFEPDRVYNGNDGGVYVSKDHGHDGTWKHSQHMPWSQFFTIDVSQQDPSRVNGGVQDNGSLRTWGSPQGWNMYYGGDGVQNVINPFDRRNVFACSQYGACGRSDDGGDTMQDFDQNTVSDRHGWLSPIVFQPGSANVVYYAGDILNRSEDRGRTWTAISPDLGKGDAGGETNPLYAAHYGTIQAIGLNRKKPQVIYAGTDNGYLWKTTDLGASWSEIEKAPLPQQWITHIEVKRSAPRVLYVTYSGYRSGNETAYVFRSRDGGKTFTDISANLPQAPVNDLVLKGRRLFVATDVGVFTSSARHIAWSSVGTGLPVVPINDLRYVSTNRTLYAGTFGHGVFALSLS